MLLAVLANLIINDSQTCTYAQYVVLWTLIGLFCATNFQLCFTDSVTTGDARHTVLLFPGWLMPERILRALFPKSFKPKHAGLPGQGSLASTVAVTSAGPTWEDELYQHLGLSLSTKVVILPDIPETNPDRAKIYLHFEKGDGRLTFGDWLQAFLTTGTFFTLAVLNAAYVSCVFPNYDPRDVHTAGRAPLCLLRVLPLSNLMPSILRPSYAVCITVCVLHSIPTRAFFPSVCEHTRPVKFLFKAWDKNVCKSHYLK